MRISFFGASQTVTGSQFLLEINGSRLLLECGLFQGRRLDTYSLNGSFKHNPRKVDAMILSHAHIDHSGNIPNLIKHGYNGPIYTTPATADLADVMLHDSAHIQMADIEFVNKRRARKGEVPLEPLYTLEDAAEVKQHFAPQKYNEPFSPVPGVTATLVEAGHILGSAAVVLDIEEKGRKYRFWFSGDIGRFGLPLLKDPVLPEKVDYLMMECTYGNKPHDDPKAAFAEFRDVILRTVDRGGKVIIPAFAVGRTQELVLELNEMTQRKELPPIPVYVDSPLAVNATEVFKKHPECYDEETWQFVKEARHPALDYDQLTYTHSVDESKALNDRKEPMIIISASGMAENGRILHHLRNNIEDSRNTILIVSWQAPYTLGRRLADREKRVRIFGEEFIRRADVATIGGLSSHAGHDLLQRYALNCKGQTQKIILVHGEPPAANSLMDSLKQAGAPEIVYPAMRDFVDI